MSPAEKAHAMTLLESGRADLVMPGLSPVLQMKQSMAQAGELAVELKRIIEDNGLSKVFKLGAKPYVYVDGWLTAARIQNESTFSKVTEITLDPETGSKVVRAEGWLEDASGRIVSRAESCVSADERQWSDKPLYALLSMAETRAIGKAMRIRHAWIMVMAGYSPTPVEEMEGIDLGPDPEPAPAPKPPPKRAPVVDNRPPLKVTKKSEQPKPEPVDPMDVQAPAPDAGLEVLSIIGFGDVKNKRMGCRCVFEDGSEGWANSWSSTEQELIKNKVLGAKREAKAAGLDAGKVGYQFVAKVKRKPTPDGVGEWVDISDLVEVTHGN